MLKKRIKAKAALVPADRQRFDMDEDYARQVMAEYEKNEN
jgi:hypothetical protein